MIAHACEGVWGLACDPWKQQAVERIHRIKDRPPEKSLIVIGHDASVFASDLEPIPSNTRKKIQDSWPGHVTWILPNQRFPSWITGNRSTVAVRVPDHSQARRLCREFGGPLVSTSANKSGSPPATKERETRCLFADQVDMVVSGQIGGATGPSEIYVASTGERIR